jgi:SOS-response transcriptional repressor LexA
MGQLLGEVDLTPRLLHKKKQNARARLIPLIEQSTFNGKLSKSEKDYLVANIQLSQQAFAMKVTENNMNPAIPEGAIIVVEPTLKPSNNKFVLIKEGSGYHIKLYLSKENHHLLSASLNDFSTIKKITSKSVIIGTIIHIFFNEVI